MGSYVSPLGHLQNLPVKLRVYRLCVLGGCGDDDDDDDDDAGFELGLRVHRVRVLVVCACGSVTVVEEVAVGLLDVGQSHRNFRR
jgi:hypothetical protein